MTLLLVHSQFLSNLVWCKNLEIQKPHLVLSVWVTKENIHQIVPFPTQRKGSQYYLFNNRHTVLIFFHEKIFLNVFSITLHKNKTTNSPNVKQTMQDERYEIFFFNVLFYLHDRFANLSVNTAMNDGMSSRTATPMYHSELSPAMSHTYINQYAGSEYHLDRVQTPQMPYMPFDVDAAYEDCNYSAYQPNAGYDNGFLWITIFLLIRDSFSRNYNFLLLIKEFFSIFYIAFLIKP